MVYREHAWHEFEMTFRAKKFTNRVKVLVVPPPPADPVALDLPPAATTKEKWNDLRLAVAGGKATLFAGDEELASAPVPAGVRLRPGFEAPSGATGGFCQIRILRRYRNDAPVAEEGFSLLFDGAWLGQWAAHGDAASCFEVKDGLLCGEVRTKEAALLSWRGGRWAAYELRFRVLWGTTGLILRAVEVPGAGGNISILASKQVDLTDYLDPQDVSDVEVRVADGRFRVTLNGKKIFEEIAGKFDPTPIAFILAQGKKFRLRDIRLKDLGGGAGSPPAPGPAAGKGKKADEGVRAWKPEPDGVFTQEEGGGAWKAENAGTTPAALAAEGAQVQSYTLSFRVARGARGLSLVPRAQRGATRATGIPLADDLFATEEWTDVSLVVDLLDATVTVGGRRHSTLDLDDAVGPPALRLGAGGAARVKDLKLETKK